jgi:hypothetical protein
MSINLHSGGELVSYETLRELKTPEPTRTHVPVEHFRLVDLVRGTLNMFGHTIEDEHYALDRDGMRFFGLMSLKSTYTGYRDTLGLRNSHDRTFPIGIGFGSEVFVCSNLAFASEHIIKRKHTLNAKRELPGLLMEIIEPLALQREAQSKKLLGYQTTPLCDQRADHAIMQLYRRGAINLHRIPEIMGQWEKPAHDWGDKTVWRMFNATTFTLTGKVAEKPRSTQVLHDVMDAIVEQVH